MLERDCLRYLREWYRGNGRKPVLLRGARQVGKTTLVRILADELGLQLIELNMEKPWGFTSTLGALDPHKTLEAIEFELNVDIEPAGALVFFDEVQACPAVLPLLRYFREEAPAYKVIATGSLLEFALAEPSFSVPVGRIELLYLGPLSFREFLGAVGEEKAAKWLEGFAVGDETPLSVHEKLTRLVRTYTIVGGMPEAVDSFRRYRRLRETERIKAGIIDTFRLDFNKYHGKASPARLTAVLDAMPRLVGRKLMYSHLDSRVRSAELSRAVDQLCMARLMAKVFNTHANGVPLAAEKNERFFKMLLLDVGLLLTQLKLVPTEVELVEELNLVNNGTLAEQFIGQQLLYSLAPPYAEPELFYWAREKRASSAEVDYVIVAGDQRIVPVEVKAGSTGSLRSLHVMVLEKGLSLAVRFDSAPPTLHHEERGTVKGKVRFTLVSLPHYLVQEVPRLLEAL